MDTIINKTIVRVTVTAKTALDEHPDLSWLGEYSNNPTEHAIETGYAPETGNIKCACGRVYTWSGWLISERTTQ